MSRDDEWRRTKTENALNKMDKSDAKLLRDFLEKERLSPGAEGVYAFAVQGFERACERPFTEIEKGDLQRWLRWNEEKAELTGARVNYKMSVP